LADQRRGAAILVLAAGLVVPLLLQVLRVRRPSVSQEPVAESFER
jgi:hypothetical protein